MNKNIALFTVVFLFTAASCTNEPAPVKKEVIIVVPKKEEPKPTSITLDKTGVKVETKKIKVDVKPQ